MLVFALFFQTYSAFVMQPVIADQINNIRGDIYAGLTATGVGSGVGPIVEMVGAIFISFFAALSGGTLVYMLFLTYRMRLHKKVKTITIAPF